MKGDDWYLSAPGKESGLIEPPVRLTFDSDAQLGMVLFLDSEGRVYPRGYNWNVHGLRRKFCVIE